jgi:hypothetical protein
MKTHLLELKITDVTHDVSPDCAFYKQVIIDQVNHPEYGARVGPDSKDRACEMQLTTENLVVGRHILRTDRELDKKFKFLPVDYRRAMYASRTNVHEYRVNVCTDGALKEYLWFVKKEIYAEYESGIARLTRIAVKECGANFKAQRRLKRIEKMTWRERLTFLFKKELPNG